MYSAAAHQLAAAERARTDVLAGAYLAAEAAGREFGAVEHRAGRRTARAAVGAVANGLAGAFVAGLLAERQRGQSHG